MLYIYDSSILGLDKEDERFNCEFDYYDGGAIVSNWDVLEFFQYINIYDSHFNDKELLQAFANDSKLDLDVTFCDLDELADFLIFEYIQDVINVVNKFLDYPIFICEGVIITSEEDKQEFYQLMEDLRDE